MSITDQALIDLREAMLAMTDIANDNMPNARKVTKGATLTIMERSLARTKSMPTPLRQHLAFRDLSDYISISQKNKSNLARPLNTDLLPVCNPMSTREHALTAAALRQSEARWLASDPRITDDEARALLASAMTAAPFSDDRAYYTARLSALPQGVLPLEALIAGLGDGNSTAARRARAQLQKRDSEGKFAWQGGGLSALIRRADGKVYNLSGRMVGQGIDGDDAFYMELPDGKIARVPAQAAKSSKAYLDVNETADGFAPKPAKYSSSDPVLNESDIEYVDAPNGFTKDPNYPGPGVRYTDDYYSVIRYDAGDPSTPADNGTDPAKPTFQISRINDDGTETLLGYADNWSGAQDGIRADQPKRDEEEGRSPDPIAVLPDENGDLPETSDPEVDLEPIPEDAPEAAPIAAMEWDVDPRAWNVRRDGYAPRGRRNQASDDYTDDPADLAINFDEEELADALQQAVTPEDDFSDANGVGQLRFSEGDEDVPAAALYQALREQGADADARLAAIYDEMNGNDNNKNALAQSRGESPTIAELPDATEAPQTPETPESNPGLALEDLPEGMQGMTSEEFAKFLEDGDYTPYLLENQDLDFPEGYNYLDLDPSEPITQEDRDAAGLPDAVDTNPVNLAMSYNKDDLLDQLRQAVEPNSENPGYGQLVFDDGSEEGFVANVPAEAIRDALQLQAVDTNGFLQEIASEGYAGQEEDIQEAEASEILAELDGTPEDMSSAGPELDREALTKAAEDLALEAKTIEAIQTGDLEEIRLALDFDRNYQDAKQDYDTRMDVDLPRRVQQEDWSRFERFENLLDPQPTPDPVAEIPETDTLDPMPEGPPANARNPFSPNQHWMWIERNAFIPGDTDRWALTPKGQALKDRQAPEVAPEPKGVIREPHPKKPTNWHEGGLVSPGGDWQWVPAQYGGHLGFWMPTEQGRLKKPSEKEAAALWEDPTSKAILDDIAKDIPGLDIDSVIDAAKYDEWADMPERTLEPDDMPDDAVLEDVKASLEKAAADAGIEVPPVDPNAAAMQQIAEMVQAMQLEIDRLRGEVERLQADRDSTDSEESSILDLEQSIEEAKSVVQAEIPGGLATWERYLMGDESSPTTPESSTPESSFPDDSTPSEDDIRLVPTSPSGDTFEVFLEPMGPGWNIVIQDVDGRRVVVGATNSRERAVARVVEIHDGIEDGSYDANKYIEQANRPETPGPVETNDAISAVAPNGKKYDVRVVVNELGEYEVQVHAADGQAITIGVYDDANGANIQQEHVANLIGENAAFGIDRMIAAANRARPERLDDTANPHVMPERLGEGGEGRTRGAARRGRRAANGNNNDTPMIPILDAMRGRVRAVRDNAAMQRARSQLKKYFSGWDTRGNGHPRPTHEIESRPVRPNHFDEKYVDQNGNVIRVGDIVVHNRAGEMVNPDWFPVNLIKGRVVDRGSIWRGGKRHDGYLTIQVLESDGGEWDGQFFTYKSNMTEIIEQPDIKPRIEAEIAARGETIKEALHRTMWNASNEELFKMYDIYRRVGNPELLAEIDKEMYKRWLVPPQGMADYLNWMTDEGLAALPDDIAMSEGFNGLVLRRLIKNERNRRARGIGPNGPRPNIPENIFEPQRADEIMQDNPAEARRPAPRPAPARRPEPAPVPQQANPVEAPEAPARAQRRMEQEAAGGIPPVDERNLIERFVNQSDAQVMPQGGLAKNPDTTNVVDPNLGVINPDAANPAAKQADYAVDGWDDKRAAEIAEAARTRISTKKIAELVTRLSAITQGHIQPNDPGEALDLQTQIEDGIRMIYGIGGVQFGTDNLMLDENARVTFDYYPGMTYIGIGATGNILDEDGINRGRFERHMNIDLNDPSKSYADNEYLKTWDKNQAENGAGGMSDSFNRWMENFYIANGITKVNVHAVGGHGWTGAARWALNNFNWASRSGGMSMFQDLETHVSALKRRDPDQYAAISSDFERLKARVQASENDPSIPLPTPLQFVMLGWRPGMYKDWPGWNFMVNKDWRGTKDLTPKSAVQKERMGYEDFYQKSRERIKQQLNVFQASPEFTRPFTEESFYALPGQAVLAPYRDEFMPFFDNPVGLSLARLSPPARHALQIWNSRELRNFTGDSAVDGVNLMNQLRTEAMAYDTTAANLGPSHDTLIKASVSDIRDAAGSRQPLVIQRGNITTTFSVRRLVGNDAGVMDTYMLTDQASGQILFAKLDTARTTNEEVNDNALARALGMRGAAFVAKNEGGDIMFTTFAGNGIRNATDLRRASDSGIGWGQAASKADQFALSDVVSMAILDAVIRNGDRHSNNWLVAHLDTYGIKDPNNADNFETKIPLAIDHGHAQLQRMIDSGDITGAADRLARGAGGGGGGGGGAIEMFGARMRALSVETRTIAIRAAAEAGIARLESLRPPGMSDSVYDTMIARLTEIRDAPSSTWRF